MRRIVLGAVLSASLFSCAQDGGDGALGDAGDEVAGDHDAAQGGEGPDESVADAGDAEPAPRDAGGERDAGANRDAGRREDAGVSADAGTARDSGASNTSDAGGAGGVGCAGKSYKLCEDFESAAAGALPSGWSAVSGWSSGAALVTSDEHRSGEKALKSAAALNGQPRAGRSLSALGATANKHWGRVFYKFALPASIPPVADPANFEWLHNTLVALKGSTESRVVDTVVDTSGKHSFLYNIPDDSCCTESSYSYTYDGKWHCAEWYVDAATQQYRFFYDGTEVNNGFSYGASSTKAHIGQYTQVILGLINYQTPKKANQAWFDDLAIDDNRIGCE